MVPHRLPVIYRDEHFVAVNKPAGIKVHRGYGDGRGERFVVQILRDQLGRRIYPVHRLDRATSGVLLVSLSAEAARRMAEAFAAEGLAKTYLAVVRGHPPQAGVIDHPLRRDAYDQSLHKDTQTAVTAYRRLRRTELPVAVSRYANSRYALLQIEPLTGRMHQIRRHMHHIAHPVIGDTHYGDSRHNRFFERVFRCRRLLLAATELIFLHPWSGQPIRLVACLDEVFGGALRRLGWLDAVPAEWLPGAPRPPGSA